MLEQHLADLMQPWLSRYRSQEPGKSMAAAEWKAALTDMTLPVTSDPRQKLKWVELLLARSKAKPGVSDTSAAAKPGLSAAARHAIEKRKKEYKKLKEERRKF